MQVTTTHTQVIPVKLTRETVIEVAKTAIIRSFDNTLSTERFYVIDNGNLSIRKRWSAHNKDSWELMIIRPATENDIVMVKALQTLSHYKE